MTMKAKMIIAACCGVQMLVDKHMLNSQEEAELLDTLNISVQDQWLLLLYRHASTK